MSPGQRATIDALASLSLGLSGYANVGVEGRFLKVIAEPKSWQEARRTCRAEGADLVIVDHPLINDWLAKRDPNLKELWIGASDTVRHEST